MTPWTNHKARYKHLFVCQVVTLSMFTTEGTSIESIPAKAKESNQPFCFDAAAP